MDLINNFKKHYRCLSTDAEFEKELLAVKRFKSVWTRYANSGKINIHLTINRLIYFFNIFEHDFIKQILFAYTHRKHHVLLNTFILYLGYATDTENIDSELLSDIYKSMER